MSENKVKELIKIFDGNIDLALFYVTWIKNGLNASKAYKELHPDITDGSAEVLGSRMLGKVSRSAIMEAYGLDQNLYFTQLKEALGATKWNDFTGEREPDHRVRKDYHDKLGKLLGIETDSPIVQITNMKMEVVEDAEKVEPLAVPSVQGSTQV